MITIILIFVAPFGNRQFDVHRVFFDVAMFPYLLSLTVLASVLNNRNEARSTYYNKNHKINPQCYLQYFFGLVVGIRDMQLSFRQCHVGIAAGDHMVFTFCCQHELATASFPQSMCIITNKHNSTYLFNTEIREYISRLQAVST